jgi:hypothetical protein
VAEGPEWVPLREGGSESEAASSLGAAWEELDKGGRMGQKR